MIKTKIETLVQDNPKSSFFSILSAVNQDRSEFSQLTKPELGDLLRQLEASKKLVQVNNYYYHHSLFPVRSGHTHFNLNNNNCWVHHQDLTNEFGIAFQTHQEFLPVLNKKEATLKAKVDHFLIPLDDEGHVELNFDEAKSHASFLSDTLSADPLNAIAVFYAEANQWIVLNTALAHPIVLADNSEFKHKDVALFERVGSEWKVVKKLRNMEKAGVESEIAMHLANIEDAFAKPGYFYEEFLPVHNRSRDLTDLNFCTIDSIYTKDIDDAIFAEKTESGYKMYVAIADVSRFVPKGSLEDKMAKQNATSFYLPHQTVHMLPSSLSQFNCSLMVGNPRFSVVVETDIDLDGSIADFKIYEALIISKARLTYEDANLLLEDKPTTDSLAYDDYITMVFEHSKTVKPAVKESLECLLNIAHLTHADTGAMFEPHPEMVLGDDRKIDHLYLDVQESNSQKIVESAMLIANKLVAQFIFDHYPNLGIFRNQHKPLVQDANGHMVIDTSKLKPAAYHHDNHGHFGLQAEYYTHFTSPIRRYCDLVVHRLIKDIIYDLPRSYDEEELKSIADHINIQNFKSKQAQLKAKSLLMSQYLERLIYTNTLDTSVIVHEVKANGINFRNSQLLDFFVPNFKLDPSIARQITDLVKQDNPDFNALKDSLNATYSISIKIENFLPLINKKEVLAQFSQKT